MRNVEFLKVGRNALEFHGIIQVSSFKPRSSESPPDYDHREEAAIRIDPVAIRPLGLGSRLSIS